MASLMWSACCGSGARCPSTLQSSWRCKLPPDRCAGSVQDAACCWMALLYPSAPAQAWFVLGRIAAFTTRSACTCACAQHSTAECHWTHAEPNVRTLMGSRDVCTCRCIMLCADHGPCVSGAHNAIVTSRAGKDLVSCLVSGLLTIGPRFGGAIDDAARYAPCAGSTVIAWIDLYALPAARLISTIITVLGCRLSDNLGAVAFSAASPCCLHLRQLSWHSQQVCPNDDTCSRYLIEHVCVCQVLQGCSRKAARPSSVCGGPEETGQARAWHWSPHQIKGQQRRTCGAAAAVCAQGEAVSACMGSSPACAWCGMRLSSTPPANRQPTTVL